LLFIKMKNVYLNILVVVAFTVMAVNGIDVKCENTVVDPKTGHSYYYDLSMLHHGNETYIDYIIYRTDTFYVFYVNFCGQTSSPCKEDDTSVCIRFPDFEYFSGGSTTTQTISVSDRSDYPSPGTVMVTYSNGMRCGYDTFKTKIYITCKEGTTPGYIYNYENTSACELSLFMYSQAGCPVGPAPVKCETTLTQAGKDYFYDLSALYHDQHTLVDPLFYKTEDDTYYVNFCGQTATACESHDTSVCIRYADGGDYKYVNGGSTSTQTFSSTEGQPAGQSVTVTYSKGDKCKGGLKKTNLVVNCKDATPGFFYDIKEIDDCETTLYMYSASGCAK